MELMEKSFFTAIADPALEPGVFGSGTPLATLCFALVALFAAVAIVVLVQRRRRWRAAWRAQAVATDTAGGTLDEVCARLSSPGVGTATMLADNTVAWAARWRLIESATRSIDFATFILGGDAFGLALLGALLRKQEAGIKVRVLVDSFGLRWGSKVPLRLDPLRTLRAAGADVRIYNMLSWKHLGILLRRKSLLPLFACDHDKLLLIDGESAVCGGRNIAPDYFAHPDDDELCFSDRDVLLRGGGSIAGFLHAFECERRCAVTRKLRLRPQNEPMRRLMLAAADGMDRWLTADPFTAEELERLDAPSSQERAELVERTLAGLAAAAQSTGQLPGRHASPSTQSPHDDAALATVPAPAPNSLAARASFRLLRRAGGNIAVEAERYLDLAAALAAQPRLRGALRAELPPENVADMSVLNASSALNGEDQRLNEALLRLLAAARSTVLIESPYLMLAERALLALEQAAKRGVQITIVTNGPTSTDNAPAEAFFLRTWPRILARVPTLRIFVLNGKHNAHGKTAVIDGHVAIVGSYNLDIISAAVNGEVAVVLRGEQIVQAVAAPILARLAEGKNSVVEYRIDRRELANGSVVEAYGPADHVPLRKRFAMQVLSQVVSLLRYLPGIAKP